MANLHDGEDEDGKPRSAVSHPQSAVCPLRLTLSRRAPSSIRYPSALPQVERSSIKQDLHRRDFTINTLAICLDPDRWGELLDFYGGEQDLRDGVIRVLHSLSFVEDPTRMLRAVRFEQRLELFTSSRARSSLMAHALDLLDRVSGDRIRHELTAHLSGGAARRGAVPLAPTARASADLCGLDVRRVAARKIRAVRKAFEDDEWPVPKRDGVGAADVCVPGAVVLPARRDGTGSRHHAAQDSQRAGR